MATHPTIYPPPGHEALTYFSSDPPPKNLPTGFLDAMAVRKHVFIDEQKCKPEGEVDYDDCRSFHWVVYASVGSKKGSSGSPLSSPADGVKGEWEKRISAGGKVPVGVVRLVPPPHNFHPAPGSVDGKGGETDIPRVPYGDRKTRFHNGKEPYAKIGRMATVKSFRGLGLGKLLVHETLNWAAANKRYLDMLPDDPIEKERIKIEGKEEYEWKGLIMAHAQVTARKFYEGFGFEVDEELGTWIEEGIEHVAMWKRVEIIPERKLP